MKSEITVEKEPYKFPCLMIHAEEGFVVLFENEATGTVLYEPNKMYSHMIGKSYTDYNIDSFREFKGSVNLSNKRRL